MEQSVSNSSTLRDYFRIIFRHKIIFAVLPIVIIIPVFFTQQLTSPKYMSSVKMFVKAKFQTEVDYYRGIGGDVMQAHFELVNSNIVIERVVDALKLYEIPVDYELKFATQVKAALIKSGIEKTKQRLMEMPDEQRQKVLFRRAVGRLAGQVSVTRVENSSFFTINVTDFDPIVSQIAANSVSRSYLIFDLEQQIIELKLKYGPKHSSVLQLQNHIDELELTLHGKPLPDIEAIGPATVKIVAQAKPGGRVTEVNKFVTFIVSFFGGIILSIVYCFAFEIVDQSVRSPMDIERFLKIPYIGSLPKRKSRERIIANRGNSECSISFQNLAEKLALMTKDRNIKTLLVTDIERTVETPEIISNLGAYLANKLGWKILIIDADLRNSSISKTFNIPSQPGLADVYQGNVSFTDIVQDLGANLFVLPSGESSLTSATFFQSPVMSDLIREYSEHYDLVLISSTDLKNFIDGEILSNIADSTVIIIQEGKVRRQVVENVITPLKQKNVNIMGAILNDRKHVIPGIIYKLT